MDFHAAGEPDPFRDTALTDVAYNGRNRGETNHAEQPVGSNGKQEIRYGPSGSNSDTFRWGLGIERLILELFGHRPFPLIQHFHVATERDRRNRKLGALPVVPRKQRLPETNRKPQNLDTAAASHPKVTSFMERHQNAQREYQRQYGFNDLHNALCW